MKTMSWNSLRLKISISMVKEEQFGIGLASLYQNYQPMQLLSYVSFCATDLGEHVHNVWSSKWLIEQIIGCHFYPPIKCVMRISFSASFLCWHISVLWLFVWKGRPVNIHPMCVFTNKENATTSCCDSDVHLYVTWTATHFKICMCLLKCHSTHTFLCFTEEMPEIRLGYNK